MLKEELKLAENRRYYIRNMMKHMFSEANDILWICTFQAEEFFVSDKLKKICGYDDKLELDNLEQLSKIVYVRDRKLINSLFEDLYSGKKDKIKSNIRFLCCDGQIKNIEIIGTRYEVQDTYNNNIIILSGIFYDLNRRKKLEDKLNYAAYHDRLTGLPNRSLFVYKANVIINQCNGNTAVIYFDLDNFKRMNDLYGRYIGNHIIKEISCNLKNELVSQQTLARPDSDEFLLLIPDVESIDMVKKQIDKMLQLINKPLNIGEIEIQFPCSAGIALFPCDGRDIEELIKNANVAMYKAKEKGKNQCFIFDKAINIEIRKKTEMENNLRNAICGNELYLVYQPQIESNSLKLVGLEALLRWESLTYGNVPPSTFIPIAEQTGLIIPIGLWVIEQACKQCKYWYEKYKLEVPISINVSAIQLNSNNFIKTFLIILNKYQLPLRLIKLEITESILMENYESTTRILELLRSVGISIALDDFGTGYSSLNYLKSLPLDTLKIDKTFVATLKNGNREHVIVNAMIHLAHILNMNVIAEGVETAEQFECLVNTSCNIIQGYYFSKPILPEEIEKQWFSK